MSNLPMPTYRNDVVVVADHLWAKTKMQPAGRPVRRRNLIGLIESRGLADCRIAFLSKMQLCDHTSVISYCNTAVLASPRQHPSLL